MTSRQLKKIRYVKCPKCARILPEPEQIPLYTCGGCGTILKAKYYKKQKEPIAPALPTVDSVRSNDNGHACEVEKSSLSSQRSPEDQSSVQNGDIDETAITNCNSDQIGDDISSHRTSLPEEPSAVNVEGGDSGESSEEKADQSASAGDVINRKLEQVGTTDSVGEFSSDKGLSVANDREPEQLSTEIVTREDGAAVQKQDDEQIVKANLACDTSTVNEAKQVKNDTWEQCEDISIEKPEEFRHEDSMTQAPTMIQSQFIEKSTELGPVNVAEGDEVSVNETDCLADDKVEGISKLGKEDKTGKEQKSFIERLREKLASVTISNDSSKPAEVEDRIENSLSVAEASLDAFASGNTATNVATSIVSERTTSDVALSIASERTASDVVPQDCDRELSLLEDVKEPLVENIENFDGSAFTKSRQNRLTSNAEIPNPLDTHEEVSNLVKETSRSSIKEPLAYDGSVSSCDGNDDRVPGEPEHLNGGAWTGNDGTPDYIGAEEDSRSQPRGKMSVSQLSHERPKRNMLEEEESERRIDRQGCNTTAQRQGCNTTTQRQHGVFPPRVPFPWKSTESAFETGSSSSYVNDEPPSNWTRNNPYRYGEREQWRRMTYDQRDFMKGRRLPEAPWMENDALPLYHNDELFPRDFYQKERYHGYSDSDVRRRPGSRFLSGNLPRTDYSGEVYSRGYQIHSGEIYNERYLMPDHYMDRHPDAPRRKSAQLPPGPPRYREGPMTYMDPFTETSRDPYDPYPTNPHRLLDFESYGLTYDRAYLSDDQRHEDWIMRRPHMKEKLKVTRRHVRPMAGGAPFITCHFCLEVLQLPDEFLLFKQKRIHQLKCGVCCNILKFSLKNDSCLAPRLPFPNEAENNHLDSPRHNSFGPPGRGQSKLESRNSRTEAIVDESSDGASNAAPSSVESRQVKVTWHLPSRRKSPLHKLLGYSSPQDLLAVHTPDNSE